MDTQEDLSNKLITKSDNILKKRRHKKEQLEVKKDNPKPVHKSSKSNKLPVDFAGLLVRCENEGYLTISISNSSYKTYKELVKLQWLKAVSLKNNELKFKLTNLGNGILKDIKPTGYSDETLISKISSISTIPCGFMALVSIISALIFKIFKVSTPLLNRSIDIGGTFILIGLAFFSLFFISNYYTNRHRIYLTTNNCTKVASKYLDNHQLKCKEQLLDKYAKEG